MAGGENVIAQESVSRKEGRKTGEMLSSPQAELGGRDKLFQRGQKHGRGRLRRHHADQRLQIIRDGCLLIETTLKVPHSPNFQILSFRVGHVGHHQK